MLLCVPDSLSHVSLHISMQRQKQHSADFEIFTAYGPASLKLNEGVANVEALDSSRSECTHRAGSQAPPWPRSELYFIRSEFFGMILQVSYSLPQNESLHFKQQPLVSPL